VVGLSETLYRELSSAGSGVGVSVLCPGAVPTAILDAALHWPSRLGTPPPPGPAPDAYPELDEMMAPAVVADIVFDAVARGEFWILTHRDQYAPAMRARTEGAVTGRNPDDESVDPNFRAERGRKPGNYGDEGDAVTRASSGR
jgi:short-subunit dehydrogenase